MGWMVMTAARIAVAAYAPKTMCRVTCAAVEVVNGSASPPKSIAKATPWKVERTFRATLQNGLKSRRQDDLHHPRKLPPTWRLLPMRQTPQEIQGMPGLPQTGCTKEDPETDAYTYSDTMNAQYKSEDYQRGFRDAAEKYKLVFDDQLNRSKFLRDEFAMACLPSVHLHALQDNWAKGGEHWREVIAQECYKIAEAMIEARKHTY